VASQMMQFLLPSLRKNVNDNKIIF